MKKFILILTVNLFISGGLFAQLTQPDTSIKGRWMGRLVINSTIKLRIVFVFNVKDNKLIATMESPDQGAKDIKVDEISYSYKMLHLEINSLHVKYDGVYSNSDTSISGTFDQNEKSFSLDLKPQPKEKPKVANPLVTESDIVLKTSTGNIYGTLTIPKNANTSPLVIIVAGSGPTNRDGNSILGVQANTYKLLSEGLANNGISTLRYDKRGIGESREALKSEKDIRFDNYIDDLVAWISLLKSDARFSNIFILGHSEGSLIGIIAAEKTNISGLISVAGAGKTIDKILQEQLKEKLTPQLIKESNKILDKLKRGDTVSKVSSDLMSIYRPDIQPYMISWLKYNPTEEIKKLKMPVLIIQGTTDLQVTVDDAKLLSSAKPDSKLVIIKNMNHVLKESDSDIQKNSATYINPDLPLKAGLIETFVDFIKTKK